MLEYTMIISWNQTAKLLYLNIHRLMLHLAIEEFVSHILGFHSEGEYLSFITSKQLPTREIDIISYNCQLHYQPGNIFFAWINKNQIH